MCKPGLDPIDCKSSLALRMTFLGPPVVLQQLNWNKHKVGFREAHKSKNMLKTALLLMQDVLCMY